MSHTLRKHRSLEDLESCVTFTVGAVLAFHTFHTWWFDPTAAEERASSRQ